MFRKERIASAECAAELIRDNQVVAAATVGLNGWPQEIALAIGERFQKTGSPKNITLVHTSTCGDYGDNKNGTNALAHEGLVRRLICAHTGAAIHMVRLVSEGKAECVFFPQGVFPQMWRSVSGNKPGVITKVGLHTFIDPRVGEGSDGYIEILEIDGEEWLRYKNIIPDVALLRGTACDEDGNMTLDEDIAFMEQLSLASAVKNHGGTVICQVKYLAKSGTLHPKSVKVPAALIDHIVVAKKTENHMQTQQTKYNPAFAGKIKVPTEKITPMPLDARKLIVRRAARELKPGYLVNLGVGMPLGIASIVAEENIAGITLTTETGSFGGTPAGGLDFGACYNAQATVEHAAMFDLYDGGGLDIAFLGMAEADRHGNVNVSKLGNKPNGPGGFINITQNTKNIVFCGTFTTNAKIAVTDGKIEILEEGIPNKFVENVAQITFSGEYAAQTAQNILYVTERCVFKLEGRKLRLIEVADGIDIQTQILDLMPFAPEVGEICTVSNCS